MEAIVNHDISFQAQSHRLGLGWNIYNPNPSVKGRRKLASQTVGKLEAEHLLSHAFSLPLNDACTTWMDRAEPFNLTWKNLIFGPGSKLLSFVLNSTANSVITPAMLQMLGYSESSACPLCEKPKRPLFHILSNCQSALDRYTRRHDSVLATLKPALSYAINCQNKRKSSCKSPQLWDFFVKSGNDSSTKKSQKLHGFLSNDSSLLAGVYDWKLSIDFHAKQVVFPPCICATDQRPDIVIFSRSAKKVIMIELTCPAEENFNKAELRKTVKYQELQSLITTSSNGEWKPFLLTIEVGARGFVSYSVSSCLKKLGIHGKFIKRICAAISLVAARCSYAIWVHHKYPVWSIGDDELVTVSLFDQQQQLYF